MIASAAMNNTWLRESIHQHATTISEERLGFWKFEYDGRLTIA